MVAKLDGFSGAITAAMHAGKAAVEHREVESLTLGFKGDLRACHTDEDVQTLLTAALKRAGTLETEFTNPVAAGLGGSVTSQLAYQLNAAAQARKLEFKVPAALDRLQSAFVDAPELEATRKATAEMIGGVGHNDARITDREELDVIVKAFSEDLKACLTVEKVNEALEKACAALDGVDKLEALTLNPRMPGQGLVDVVLRQTASALLKERLHLVAELRRVDLTSAPTTWY
jgi:hypothetical protein